MTHTSITRPCVSQASEIACLINVTDTGVTSTAQTMCSKNAALIAFTCRPEGTIRTGQSDRATTVAVIEPYRALGSFDSGGTHDDEVGRHRPCEL